MKWLKKNSINIGIITLLLVIILVPDAKATLIRGLMTIGFFRPDVEEAISAAPNLDGLKFKDVKGNTVDLGDLKGKVIFLNFWATWCPPCRAEMPSLNKLYLQFKDDNKVVFIFADADGELSKSSKFMANHNYQMPVYKVESDMPQQIFAGALPTTIIFDQQGRLSFRHEGVANYADQKIVDFLLKLKTAR